MIHITLNADAMRAGVAQFRATLSLTTQQAMRDVMAAVAGSLSAQMGKGGLIGVRTGQMRRNIKFRVDLDADGVVGTVYVDDEQVPYFAIQDQGGTIVPKTAQALTIPLEAMLTPGGVARGTARQVREDPAAFGFKSTFIPKGHHVIFGVPLGAVRGRRGAGAQGLRDQPELGTIVPLFALASSVTLPARHLTDAALANQIGYIQSRFEAALQQAVSISIGSGAAS